LKIAQIAGLICLKYLDESGFCLGSPVSYSYVKKGEQKHLEQTRRRGKRLSILGLWEPLISFEYGLTLGSFTAESYIKLMNWQAQQAEVRLAESGRITVVVQDNGSLHTSKQVQAQYSQWEEQGLYLFFLPKYCSQMNLIEPEWHQLKTHELAGRMFEDEYDLALAVMEAVEHRGQLGEYSTQRFKFNSI
jgi:putative transposase